MLWAVATAAMDGRATDWQAEESSSRPGWKGLVTAVASIRQHDAVRPIVIMALAREPALEWLAHSFHVEIQIVPQLLSTRGRNKHCVHDVRRSLARSRRAEGRDNATIRYDDRRALEQLQMFTKLNIWTLTSFTRVLYIDTDILVARPVEELWGIHFKEHEAIAATPTLNRPPKRASTCYEYRSKRERKYNAGMLLIRPNLELYDALLSALDDPLFAFRCNNGDQMLVNNVFSHGVESRVRCLGHSFNCYDPDVVVRAKNASHASQMTRVHCGDATVLDKTLADEHNHVVGGTPHVLHFAMGTKPWLTAASSYFGSLWWSVYNVSVG